MQGQIRQPIISDPIPGTINGQPRLSAAEVTSILALAADRARTTRAGIRLPIGVQMQVFITVVNFPNQDGVAPTVLGTFRTGEATHVQLGCRGAKSAHGDRLFQQWKHTGDVHAHGWFPRAESLSARDRCQSRRSIFRTAGSSLGFTGHAAECHGESDAFQPNPDLPNGITIFPGGFPLYRNGQMIGAIGVSGDGVDQDDIVGASGTENFLTPLAIGADETVFEDARLPYAKFPRDPSGDTLNNDATVLSSPHAITIGEGLVNISSRLTIGAGEIQAIAGFIISANEPKDVLVRAIGPSLTQFGVAGVLANPALEIHDQTGALIASNNDWQDSQKAAIEARGLAPANAAEAAVSLTLLPGAYTAVMSDEANGGGIGLIEVYDLNPASDSRLANISTRGLVGTQEDVMIGGFILGGETGCSRVIVRALGPSLAALGVSGVLADPALELHDSNGALVTANDNWEETQALDLQATGLAPGDPHESATLGWLTPGAYTAVVRGNTGQNGVGLIEVYCLP